MPGQQEYRLKFPGVECKSQKKILCTAEVMSKGLIFGFGSIHRDWIMFAHFNKQ